MPLRVRPRRRGLRPSRLQLRAEVTHALHELRVLAGVCRRRRVAAGAVPPDGGCHHRSGRTKPSTSIPSPSSSVPTALRPRSRRSSFTTYLKIVRPRDPNAVTCSVGTGRTSCAAPVDRRAPDRAVREERLCRASSTREPSCSLRSCTPVRPPPRRKRNHHRHSRRRRVRPSEAHAIRDEVTKLRDEFEQLRQQYDARLASLEGRLATLQGSAPPANPAAPPAQNAAATPPAATLPPETPATPAPPPEAPQATAAAPPDAQVPSGAASGGGPEGSLPVYGNASAMSKIFNPGHRGHRQLPRRGWAQRHRADAVAGAQRSRGVVPGRRRSVRKGRLLRRRTDRKARSSRKGI